MMIIIIIKIKRPNGEALEASPPANGRPAGGVQGGAAPPTQNYYVLRRPTNFRRPAGVQGGQRPPAQHYSIIVIFIITIIIIIITIIIITIIIIIHIIRRPLGPRRCESKPLSSLLKSRASALDSDIR